MKYTVINKPTPRKKARKFPIIGMMTHKTYGPLQASLNVLTLPVGQGGRQASACVTIDKDGTRYEHVNPATETSWHGGVTDEYKRRKGTANVPDTEVAKAYYAKAKSKNPNEQLVGVEFVSMGEAITNEQVESCIEWYEGISNAPKLGQDNLYYHKQFANWKETVDLTLILNKLDGDKEPEKDDTAVEDEEDSSIEERVTELEQTAKLLVDLNKALVAKVLKK